MNEGRQIYLSKEESNKHIEKLKSILDFSLSFKPVKNIMTAYATGGTVRRLFMLENNIPMYEKDFNAMYDSDIDIHCSTDVSATPKSLLHRVTNIFDRDGEFFDTWGLCDIPLSTLKGVGKPLIELGYYNDMVLQYINIGFEVHEYDLLDDNIDYIELLFDIQSSMFLYYNGKVYDKRVDKPSDFFNDNIIINDTTTFRTIHRLIKFQEYGFKYSNNNLKAFLEESLKNNIIGEEYGKTTVDINPKVKFKATSVG